MLTSSILNSDMHAAQIKPEIKLIAILSRPQLTEQHKLKAGRLLENGVDIATFRKLLDQHRVSPCVYSNIRDHFNNIFSAQLVGELHQQYLQNVERNKFLLKTFFALLNGFKRASIPVAPVKGILLAQTLYGDVAKRHFNDIDLLIHPCNLMRANVALNALGFHCEIFDSFPTHILLRILKKQKDLIYVNAAGVMLELHLRLANVTTNLSITFNELLFTHSHNTVLYQNEAFLYLCWHGMNSFFHRLKWLCDLAIIIDTMDIDWEQMYATACRLDCVRTLTISVVLSHLIFETILPSQADKYYSNNRICRWLFALAKKNINSDALSLTPYTWCILIYVVLPTSWISKVGGITFLCKPGYHEFKTLPIYLKKMGVVYYFIRPISFLRRRRLFLKDIPATQSK